MPVRNGALFIAESIQSVIHQSYDNWELIVVDDKSIDDTAAIIQSYLLLDSRVRYFYNEGSGIIDSLKCGFKNCDGDYLTRLDADDIMTTDRLVLMSTELDRLPPKYIVTGLVSYFPKELVSIGYTKYEKWLNDTNRYGLQWTRIYRECVIASSNWMARISEMTSIDLFINLDYPEDYGIVFKWYKFGFSISTLDQITLLWRRRIGSASKSHNGFQQDAFFKMKIKYFLELEHHGEEVVIWGNNKKSKLTLELLNLNKVNFSRYDLADYRDLENKLNFKLLVAVYPEIKERIILEDYLGKLRLIEGKDWWYL